MDDRQKLLDEAKEVFKNLNQFADKATAELEATENQLIQMGAGVEVWNGRIRHETTTWVDEDEEEFPAEHIFMIGFAKIKTTWGIAINEYIQLADGEIKSDRKYLLRNSTRDIRIDALPHVDKLIAEVVAEGKRKIASLSAK